MIPMDLSRRPAISYSLTVLDVSSHHRSGRRLIERKTSTCRRWLLVRGRGRRALATAAGRQGSTLWRAVLSRLLHRRVHRSLTWGEGGERASCAGQCAVYMYDAILYAVALFWTRGISASAYNTHIYMYVVCGDYFWLFTIDSLLLMKIGGWIIHDWIYFWYDAATACMYVALIVILKIGFSVRIVNLNYDWIRTIH